MLPKFVTIDFETQPIRARPNYPPVPVGAAIDYGDSQHYLAWGHVAGNNTTFERVKRELRAVWEHAGQRPLLFHNGKFDLEVANVHFGLPLPAWHNWHDTLFMAYLADPHARDLGLKPLAQQLLGINPKEQTELQRWMAEHIPAVKKKPSSWGEHMQAAPGTVAARYAIGDVTRTRKLAKKLWPDVLAMQAAYERERRLVPILIRNEREGIQVNVPALARDVSKYSALLEQCDDAIREVLGVPELNVDSDKQLAMAIEAADLARSWQLTPKGRRSTSRKALDLSDTHLTALLNYHGALSTCLSTFMRPWLLTAQESDGRIFTNWNQVRQPGDGGGTRTGRLSSSPNFQNVPKAFKPIMGLENCPPLPSMRKYIMPDDKGSVILHRDYNQQELRIAAHFEKGRLFEMYQQNSRTDVHAEVQKHINDVLATLGLQPIDRSIAKVYDFGMLYGMGIPALAGKAGVEPDFARDIRRAHMQMLPDIKELDDDLKSIGASGEAIFTWGGRRYYCEPPAYSKKYQREMTFGYKLLNYLIQGSGADCTKEAIIRYDDARKYGRFLLTVHDESNIGCEKGAAKEEMAVLKKAMESVEFDLPMLSDGKWSSKSWGDLEEFKE
jgi:DNA polymerase I-like protein with 3'-5' exonuclease and polymerase domains